MENEAVNLVSQTNPIIQNKTFIQKWKVLNGQNKNKSNTKVSFASMINFISIITEKKKVKMKKKEEAWHTNYQIVVWKKHHRSSKADATFSRPVKLKSQPAFNLPLWLTALALDS